jgi:hypothetical protein
LLGGRMITHGEDEIEARAIEPANSSQLFDRKSSVSYFSSFSTSSVNGCTTPLGWLPALKPRNRPLPHRFMAHSAIMLRAELPVHRNRTLYSGFATT